MYDDETIVRVIPLDGCYMLQRYRVDFDDWRNMAVYDDEADANKRASKYSMTHISKQRHIYFGTNVRITTVKNEHGTDLIVSTLNGLAGNYIEQGRFNTNSDMAYTEAYSLASQLSDIKGALS